MSEETRIPVYHSECGAIVLFFNRRIAARELINHTDCILPDNTTPEALMKVHCPACGAALSSPSYNPMVERYYAYTNTSAMARILQYYSDREDSAE